MEKEKIIVGVQDDFINKHIRAYFFTSVKGKRQGWCASITAVTPITETMIFKLGRKMQIKNFHDVGYVRHHQERDFRGMLKALIADLEEFTEKDVMCCLLEIDPSCYDEVAFTPQGILLTQADIRVMILAEPAEEFIEKYGDMHQGKTWPVEKWWSGK